jgi:hypothetical protein
MVTAVSGFHVLLHRLSALELDSTQYLPCVRKAAWDPLSWTAKIPDMHFRDGYCRPFWDSHGNCRGLLSGRLKVRIPRPFGKPIEAFATVANGIQGIWVDQEIWHKKDFHRNQVPSRKPRIHIGMFDSRPGIIRDGQTTPEITHAIPLPTVCTIFKPHSNLEGHEILVSSSLLKRAFGFSMTVICGVAPVRRKFIKDVVPWSTSDQYSNK